MDDRTFTVPSEVEAPYPATPDGSLPEAYRQALDPLDALTFVAAQTKRIKLGTSVLDIPYHNPVVLARRLSTIDVLSTADCASGWVWAGIKMRWTQPAPI
jgi:alkanesulfonate monooxygenase SsuD/methylene tetrahydromethanopterin reductase-like flavin-dependent oxidoreductase (luciferase family)